MLNHLIVVQVRGIDILFVVENLDRYISMDKYLSIKIGPYCPIKKRIATIYLPVDKTLRVSVLFHTEVGFKIRIIYKLCLACEWFDWNIGRRISL